MSPVDTGRGTAARDSRQLSFFDQTLPQAREPPAPTSDTQRADPTPRTAPPGCLPDDASLWAISFAGDPRGPQERVAEASARYRARFGRAHTLVAVPLAELESYRAAGVAALGDGRLARDCVYLLHPTDDQMRESEGAT